MGRISNVSVPSVYLNQLHRGKEGNAPAFSRDTLSLDCNEKPSPFPQFFLLHAQITQRAHEPITRHALSGDPGIFALSI